MTGEHHLAIVLAWLRLARAQPPRRPQWSTESGALKRTGQVEAVGSVHVCLLRKAASRLRRTDESRGDKNEDRETDSLQLAEGRRRSIRCLTAF